MPCSDPLTTYVFAGEDLGVLDEIEPTEPQKNIWRRLVVIIVMLSYKAKLNIFSSIASNKGWGPEILEAEQFSPDIRNRRSATSFVQHAKASK